ncbi:hypothetical protein IMCGPPIG_01873 [Stenotrophomonas maltophilia]|jgi:hypothetical protein|uniref:Uncharacterized protein n=1 Tax=Stenotrophomonas maltophilia TaxID=40324 RepID=A0A2J0U9A1_STEMA|nr:MULTISPECIES: hypothetical protein [Stenotrophomonas]KKF88284.1 hypothetical protein XY58_09650 [Stenotrophomonas maltophilia]MBA0255727.1 hypothetical protein [Stenotrophomonas maltophilia]MBA0452092.1 hypothetical protein [Stenotrophomonas maltophilia]MBA0480454.1 hypothetical protein [Stenotrophomonas maltophilia]MBA0489738.1 hypothetical protein [Stenotrophomonas maltophilia]
MAEVAIDITGEEGQLTIENTVAFDLQLSGCGLCIDMTHDQGHAIYLALAAFFGPGDTTNG